MKTLNVGKIVYKTMLNNYIRQLKPHIFFSMESGRYIKMEKEHKYLMEDFVPNTILQRKINTIDQWNDIRNELITSKTQITSQTVDSAVLSVCISSKNHDLGFSYIQFLKHENISLGIAALGKYFKLYYLRNCDKDTVESVDDIYSLYKELRKQYKVFDSYTCENIIQALSITRHWRECLTLLNEIKIAGNPGAASYSVVAAACFKSKEHDLAWKLLKEAADKSRYPLSVAYLAYIDVCENSVNVPDHLEHLFDFLREYDIKCDVEVANRINELYKKFNVLTVKFVDFQNSAKCVNCHNTLQKLEPTEEEFENLKTVLFQNVIVGKNVFYRSTPIELENFKKFVANMEKYDVVIDGLNVAYSVGTKQPPHILSSLLRYVVKHFVEQNKKILVLGRTHMRKWSTSNWSYIAANADTFLAQSLSHDDPYLLYCALHSGVNTIMVTRDLMRSQSFKLSDTKLKILFNRWLLQSQYQLSYVNSMGKVFFKYPLPYAKTAQKLGDTWHIPFENTNNPSSLNKWLCLCNKLH